VKNGGKDLDKLWKRYVSLCSNKQMDDDIGLKYLKLGVLSSQGIVNAHLDPIFFQSKSMSNQKKDSHDHNSAAAATRNKSSVEEGEVSHSEHEGVAIVFDGDESSTKINSFIFALLMAINDKEQAKTMALGEEEDALSSTAISSILKPGDSLCLCERDGYLGDWLGSQRYHDQHPNEAATAAAAATTGNLIQITRRRREERKEDRGGLLMAERQMKIISGVQSSYHHIPLMHAFLDVVINLSESRQDYSSIIELMKTSKSLLLFIFPGANISQRIEDDLDLNYLSEKIARLVKSSCSGVPMTTMIAQQLKSAAATSAANFNKESGNGSSVEATNSSSSGAASTAETNPKDFNVVTLTLSICILEELIEMTETFYRLIVRGCDEVKHMAEEAGEDSKQSDDFFMQDMEERRAKIRRLIDNSFCRNPPYHFLAQRDKGGGGYHYTPEEKRQCIEGLIHSLKLLLIGWYDIEFYLAKLAKRKVDKQLVNFLIVQDVKVEECYLFASYLFQVNTLFIFMFFETFTYM